jgi:hypothetical protein
MRDCSPSATCAKTTFTLTKCTDVLVFWKVEIRVLGPSIRLIGRGFDVAHHSITVAASVGMARRRRRQVYCLGSAGPSRSQQLDLQGVFQSEVHVSAA